MTVPPDHIDVSLVPNDDGDPKREREATDGVKGAIIELAKQHGITVHEDPGAIEPDAKENEERGRKVEDATKPKLIESTAAYRKEVVVEEAFREDGSLIRRRAHKIVEARGKVSASLGELHELLDKCHGGVNYGIEIACKVVNWAREKVPTGKR